MRVRDSKGRFIKAKMPGINIDSYNQTIIIYKGKKYIFDLEKALLILRRLSK